jgi:DNA polymerase elongation subunit (family B)
VNISDYKTYGGDISKLTDIDDYIEQQIKEKYGQLFNEDELKNLKIHVITCETEEELLTKLFELIHAHDPTIIAGFNSSNFDFPYIYNRLKRLNLDPNNFMSKFGKVEYSGFEIDTPDYKYIDLKYLYSPSDGMGFGDSLESYSLNSVAEHELGFKKVEYDEDNLDELYIKDIRNFLFYNMIDTILLKKLDQKLKHIEMFNSLRRMSRSLFHVGYKGRSFLGEDLMRYLMYKDEESVVRDFLPEVKIPFAENKDKYRSFSMALKNFGAYVKEPPNNVFRGLIVDYDQSLTYNQQVIITDGSNIYTVQIGEYESFIAEHNLKDKLLYILTVDEQGNIVWKRINGWLKHKRKYPIVRIKTENGGIIEVTENHSVFIEKNGEIVLISARELNIGDKLITLRRNRLIDVINNFGVSNRYVHYETDKVIEIHKVDVNDDNYEYVYDFSVEDVERFLAFDPYSKLMILVHNTSMYPSIDVMFNIDYSTLRAKVYPLFTSAFIRYILNGLYKQYINNLTKFTDTLSKFQKLWGEICDLFSEIYSPPENNKSEFRNWNTYFTTQLMIQIFKNAHSKGYEDIIEFIQNADYFETLAYIYPLFENFAHILAIFESEINPVAYLYLVSEDNEQYKAFLKKFYHSMVLSKIRQAKIMNDTVIKQIFEYVNELKTFVIVEPANSLAHFELKTIDEVINEFFSKYIVTATGALFNKHKDKLSTQARFIQTFMKLRKQVQNRAAEEFEKGNLLLSEELERTQLAIKILLNSIAYGISILPSYVLNDKNIANTITISGRFMIKFAQYFVDKLIPEFIKNALNSMQNK